MASEPPRKVDVTIRIDKTDGAKLDDIARALESSGVTNLEVHKRLMMISGSVARHAIDALRKIAGVASVREDQQYKTQA
jgi:tRNA-dihydrouridine synthase